MNDFKTKAFNSTFWSFFETFGNQGLQFVVGIILARLLLPEDYGMVGVLAIFMGVAGVLVDSGFKTSIIRSKDLTDVDCSTIFYINLIVSVIVSSILFACATSIAALFEKPELVNITRLFALIPIINGFGLVQAALQYKNLHIKLIAEISISSNLIAGLLAIYMAYAGFSYWALIWRSIITVVIYNSLLWIMSTWRPRLLFSTKALKKHFRFSFKLLITGLVDSFFDNIYSFFFGKFYSFKELGFFTRGKGYVNMVSKTLSVAIQKVTTPLLAASNKNSADLIIYYSKMLRLTCLILYPATILLAVVAEPLIVTLIGEKWLPAVPFLQILAISALIYPVTNANSSIFEVLGRSDVVLKIVLINRPVQIIILLITLNYDSMFVVWGIVIHQIFIFILSFYFVKKVIEQNITKILVGLVSPISIAFLMGLVVTIAGFLFKQIVSIGFVLGIQLLLGLFVTYFLFYIFKIKEIKSMKMYAYNSIRIFYNKKK